MDAAERALLAQTVGDAIAGADGNALDTVLADLGWLEMLDDEPRDAIDIVFHALGAETSIDKVLVATAEHTIYDAVRRLLPGVVEMDDTTAGALWRSEYLYSRAATIYGGTAEVQRNIIARRLLDLGSDD